MSIDILGLFRMLSHGTELVHASDNSPVVKMRQPWIVVLFVINSALCQDFPPGFKFGAATASYQVEGAWNVSGRTPSIWDEFVHKQPHRIYDHSTGDVACDSYHLWQRDIQMAEELGLHFYRFSISWNRLFPNGFINKINEDGKRYYNGLIDGLIEKGIEPVVTLFHWDLPQKFQDLGGWTNPLIADWFADYSRAVYSLFSDRVKTWVTINEPLVICDMVYHTGLYAPGILSPGIGNYICIKNVLVSHARAWRIYDEEFRPKHNGRVSITNHHIWYDPAEGGTEGDAEVARQLLSGLYTHPIYSAEGGWPLIIEKIISENSAREGYRTSRLPAFTKEEIELIKGTYDYYALNYYTSRLIRPAKEGEKIGSWPLAGSADLNAFISVDPSWKQSTAWWLYVFPLGLRRQLKWFKDQYGDVEILITENGYAAEETGLNDEERVRYYKQHLKQILLSIYEDGVKVIGYTAWSLMDNFEWYCGYTASFGLYAVDFSRPQRTRTARRSAHYYAAVIKNHSLNITEDFVITSDGGCIYSHTSILIMIFINLLISIFR